MSNHQEADERITVLEDAPKPKKKSPLKITFGVALAVFGGYLMVNQLVPWYVGAGMIFFGGVWVDKELVLKAFLKGVGDFLVSVGDLLRALWGK